MCGHWRSGAHVSPETSRRAQLMIALSYPFYKGSLGSRIASNWTLICTHICRYELNLKQLKIVSQFLLQISEWKLDKDKIKSKLEIDPARQMDSGTYECMVC